MNTDLANVRADKSGLTKKNDQLTQENAQLIADLTQSRSGKGHDDGQLQIVTELKGRLVKYDELRDALMGDEAELWRLRKVGQPEDFAARMKTSKVKVVTVANLKGGVGKTTLVANLAAHFAQKGKRVLVIDFDYQGSLTRMMLLGTNLMSNSDILAHTLLGGNADGQWVCQSAREFGGALPGARLVTCGQIFDRFENRAMMSWLLGDNGEEDVRFRLARIVLDKAVQDNFDLVLIDAPPRLSFGAVNAFCASHGIVVPTVLDRLSADAVGRFLGRTNHTFRPLNPALEHAGVVGTMTKQKNMNETELVAFGVAKQGLAEWHGKSHVLAATIPHIVALSRSAGQEIGYIGKDRAQIAPLFDALGDEISAKFGL